MTSTESAHYRVAGRQAAADQKCTATVLSATKAAGGVANATAVASVAEDQLQSAEMLKAHQRWWAKPDAFPSVAPPQPSREDPFKLAPDDTAYLHRKLSSGPKRSQRGYPSETRHVAEKITNQPPPPSFELPTDPRMAQFHQTTSAAFKFLAAEPRDVHSQDQTSADGYEFTQPLYSSFSADKTFQPRKLPPRPPYDIGAATRERTIPSTMTGGRSSAPLRHNVLPMASEGSVSHTGLRPATAN